MNDGATVFQDHLKSDARDFNVENIQILRWMDLQNRKMIGFEEFFFIPLHSADQLQPFDLWKLELAHQLSFPKTFQQTQEIEPEFTHSALHWKLESRKGENYITVSNFLLFQSMKVEQTDEFHFSFNPERFLFFKM
jgi:hypothetical protein